MKNRKVYIRLIITYLVVFLIPLVICIINMEKIAKDTQENIGESVLMNLTHARRTIDNSIQEIDSIVYQLSNNTTIRNIATQMDEERKYIEISKLRATQEIMNAMQVQTFVEEYYLYLYKSDMILTPKHIYLDADTCESFFQYNGMAWEDWKLHMEKGYVKTFFPSAPTKQNTQVRDRILYVQSLNTGIGNRGTFVFPIKEEKLTALLKDTYIPSEGWGYLVNAEGKILVEIPSSKGEFCLVPEKFLEGEQKIRQAKMEGRDVEIIRSTSEDTGLSFIAVLPYECINRQVIAQQKGMLLLMTLVTGLGLVVIAILAWYRGHKIDRILQMLFSVRLVEGTQETEMKGDELSYISESLKELIRNHTDLKDSIREKELLTQSLLLQSVLNGSAEKSEEELNKNLEEYHIYLQNKKFFVLAWEFSERNQETADLPVVELSIYKQILQKELAKVLPGELYVCDLGIRTGAVISSFDKERESSALRVSLKESLQLFQKNFREHYGLQVRMAIGTVCGELSQISRSYDQILEMLQYGLTFGENVLFYEEYINTGEYYYYPMALEERLVNAVRTGNRENLHAQLKEVYQVNVLEKNVSSDMMHFLVNDMQCTVFRALHSLDGQVAIEEEEILAELWKLTRETDILVRFKRINHIFYTICSRVWEVNQEENGKQKELIREYIDQNYGNSELSLKKIAEDFGYSSTYFSKLFKDLFLENFAAYLEKVRINQVCILLEGKDTMEKIIEKTGYNSVYVMRTAFKRVKGLTPNDYRKMKGGGGKQTEPPEKDE